MCAAVAALVAVVAGYGAKSSRVQRAELALANAEVTAERPIVTVALPARARGDRRQGSRAEMEPCHA